MPKNLHKLAFALLLPLAVAAREKKSAPPGSSLDRILAEAAATNGLLPAASPGSLYSSGGRLADLARNFRASQIGDLVTILVSDRASALSKGVTNTARKSSAKTSIQSAVGPLKAKGPLTNLLDLSGDQQLQGQGSTGRESVLTTALTAVVTHVLPNANLVVEGQKEISVNSEHQLVTVRGIVRPEDLSSLNSVPSDRVGALEVRVAGKGVVADAVRRPFFLYRLLLGLLPF